VAITTASPGTLIATPVSGATVTVSIGTGNPSASTEAEAWLNSNT
jgi:hypothetical protein